jgi:dethiobiotin synthetase
LIVVSTPRLGSINHTLSVLELARHRGLTVLGIIYNRYQEGDPLIAGDSSQLFIRYLRRFGHHDCIVDLFAVEEYNRQQRSLDFGPLFRSVCF